MIPQTVQEEEEHLRQAQMLSLQGQSPWEFVRDMVEPAIRHLTSIGINVSMAQRPANRKGNCLFDSLTMLMPNAHLSEEDQLVVTKDMRELSVNWAEDRLDGLNEEGLQRLLNVITSKDGRPQNHQEMRQLLRTYLLDGMFEEVGGDLLPYILSAYLNRPIIVVDVSGSRDPSIATIFPDLIFEPEGQIGSSLFLARRNFHFEPLLYGNEEEANVMNFYNSERVRQFPATVLSPSTAAAAATTTTPAGVPPPTPSPPPSTTGSNIEELVLHLEGCVLGQHDTTEDEDDDAPILPTTNSSVADSPEKKEEKKADQFDSPVEDSHPICYVQEANGPRITHSSPYPKYRCETCNRWEIAQINTDVFVTVWCLLGAVGNT